MIADTKKEMDKSMNVVQKSLLERITRLEDENTQLKTEIKAIRETEEHLKNEVQSLRNELKQVTEHGREEGEIPPEVIADLADLKKSHEELKLATTLAVAATVEQMEVSQKKWVDLVKSEVKQEEEEKWTIVNGKAKVVSIKEVDIVNATLTEEKMRQARKLNVRITGIKEVEGTSPEEDGTTLCKQLGYKEDEPVPFVKAWRAGKDLTRERALILQFENDTSRITFLKKRVILRNLKDQTIYMDDDLTQAQVAHRKKLMSKVKAARDVGQKAF